MIVYKRTGNLTVAVILDNERVGTIKHLSTGWCYFPKGQKVGGEIFSDLRDCQKSIEGKE